MKSNLRIGVLVAVLFFSVFAIQLNAAQSTFNIVTVPKFTFNLANYTTINAAAGGEIGIFGTKIIISPGTYVDVNGKQYSNYNVSLIYFTVSGVGLPKNDQQATSTSGAIGIEVNGEISDSVRFVDSSGNPDPIKLIMGGSNRTLSTWKWSGGSISGLNYTGGSYAYPKAWLQYNSSYIYTEIDNASMQVVVISNKNAPSTSLTTSIPPDTSTVTGTSTISATTQSTTVPPKVVAVEDNSIYLYAMIAEAIVIIALIVALVIARKKGSSAQIGQIPQ